MTPTEQQLNDAVESVTEKLFNAPLYGNVTHGTAREAILSELKPLFDELAKDKERLDWLDKTNSSVNWNGYGQCFTVHKCGQTVGNIGLSYNPRGAIDAAIQQEKGKKV